MQFYDSCTELLSAKGSPTITCIPLLAFLFIGSTRYSDGEVISMADKFINTEDTPAGVRTERVVPYIVTDSDSHCADKTNGIYRHPHFISSYYICQNGEYKVHQCDEGLVFNELSLNCEQRISDISFLDVNPCEGLGETNLVPDYDSTNCQTYFRCDKDVLIEKNSCDYGMRFSLAEMKCQPASQVPCIYASCKDSVNGYFIIPGSNCQSYYKCIDGNIIYSKCPNGFVFDYDTKSCSGSGGVCHELICSGRTNGLYADTTHGCQRYYYCEGAAIKSVDGCPLGTLFNGTLCTNSSEVTCSSVQETALSIYVPATDECAGLQDGPHPGVDDFCESYILCKSGRKVVESQCPTGQRFNGVQCDNADLVPCLMFCAGKVNGFYANIRKRCEEYIECVNETILSVNNCRQGTTFNGNACESSNDYQCPNYVLNKYNNICDNLKDGFHTDYLEGCKYYFYCYKGDLLIRNTCLEGTIWNGTHCVPRSNYTCEVIPFSPECIVRDNGFFTDNSITSNCNKYYYCNNNVKVQLECPKNHSFDGFNCVLSETYKCPISDIDCYNKSNGYYVDVNSGCQSYYYCSNGNKITYVCEESTIYNGSECVSAHLYECPYFKSDSCEFLNNGYYPDLKENCKTYFYCLNNNKIMTFKCPEKELFNGYKCVSSKSSICQNFTKSTCRFFIDGMYIVIGTQCKEYFQCSNRNMISFNRCQDGLIFNGTNCSNVTKQNECDSMIRLQMETLTKCAGRSNGFYPDITSGCKTYFYCIDGVKTTLTCPSGKIFNSELCTDSKNFHCPVTNVITSTT